MANEDIKPESGSPNDDEHYERVRSSFSEWRGSVRDRLQPHDEEHIDSLQEAVLIRDSERARHHLEMTKANSGWLYEELMKHPNISAFIRELAIFGL
jgi:hypothetical protein